MGKSLNTIYLYDVSAMVHSGAYSNAGKDYGKPKREYNYNTFPTGGLYTFNQYFIEDIKRMQPGDLIIACFDGIWSKLKRTQIWPYYKSIRQIDGVDDKREELSKLSKEELNQYILNLDPKVRQKVVERKAVTVQVNVLKKILSEMNITVLYDETLEADDWIYTVVAAIGDSYNIVLRADDNDLDDCALYSNTIRKFSVSGKGELKMYKGGTIPKIFSGETGDSIPNLRVKHHKRKVYNELCLSIMKGTVPVTILDDAEKLQKYYGLKSNEVADIQLNVQLVEPMIQPEFEINEESINQERLLDYLRAFRFRKALSKFGQEPSDTEGSNEILQYAFSILPQYVQSYFSEIAFRGSSENRYQPNPQDQAVENIIKDLYDK